MKLFTGTLDQIQGVFGSDIAGNHTVIATLEDGAVVCYCDVDALNGRVYFIGHDEFLSDWDRCSEKEALTEVRRLAKG